MTLTNHTEMPPAGYLYREESLGWETPRDLATQGMRAVAQALQRVRAQNPTSGLDPSYEACVRAISEYTCARLAETRQLTYFCGGEARTQQEKAALEAAKKRAEQRVTGCASCGGRRR